MRKKESRVEKKTSERKRKKKKVRRHYFFSGDSLLGSVYSKLNAIKAKG